MVEHTNVVDYSFGAADFRLLYLDGNEEILNGQIKDDLERHFELESQLRGRS